MFFRDLVGSGLNRREFGKGWGDFRPISVNFVRLTPAKLGSVSTTCGQLCPISTEIGQAGFDQLRMGYLRPRLGRYLEERVGPNSASLGPEWSQHLAISVKLGLLSANSVLLCPIQHGILSGNPGRRKGYSGGHNRIGRLQRGGRCAPRAHVAKWGLRVRIGPIGMARRDGSPLGHFPASAVQKIRIACRTGKAPKYGHREHDDIPRVMASPVLQAECGATALVSNDVSAMDLLRFALAADQERESFGVSLRNGRPRLGIGREKRCCRRRIPRVIRS